MKLNEAPCHEDAYTKLIQAEANFQSYKQISTDAINNLKGQIEYINTVSLYLPFFFGAQRWAQIFFR